MRALTCLVMLIWVLSDSPALAWGTEGHHIVAYIAASELAPKARAEVADLLGGEATSSMVTASTWADEIRPTRRETAPWHYVNIEIGLSGYDAARDCADDDCIVAQIQREISLVGSKSLLKSVRAEALRFLIHFVGDLTQPLHCSDNHDRGGNSIRVVLDGRQTNMHAIWDTAVVQALGASDLDVASNLEKSITPADLTVWRRGTIVDWANETFAVANSVIYRNLPGTGGTDAPIVLATNYAASQRDVVARQLKRAGVRLAMVLNQTLQ